MKTLLRKSAAEICGTFFLLFFGCGSIMVNEITQGALGLLGIAIVWGLVVTILIYSLSHISGTHINPAVTIALWVQKRISFSEAIVYVVSQISAAILAVFLLGVIFGPISNLGITSPKGGYWQSFLLEIIMTGFLMLVILCLDGKESLKHLGGVIVGATITLEVLFAGPISGASMNPARSLAPALLSGRMESISLYILAPMIGSCLCVVIYQLLHHRRMDD